MAFIILQSLLLELSAVLQYLEAKQPNAPVPTIQNLSLFFPAVLQVLSYLRMPFWVPFAGSQHAACFVNRGITYLGLPLVWLCIQWTSSQTAAQIPDLRDWSSVRNTKILRQRVSYYWLLCLSLIRGFTTDSGFQGLFGNSVRRAGVGEGREQATLRVAFIVSVWC